jgi:hypothetical protein
VTIKDGALDDGAIDLGRGPLSPAAPVTVALTAEALEWLLTLTVTADHFPLTQAGRDLNSGVHLVLLAALAGASAGRRRARVPVQID